MILRRIRSAWLALLGRSPPVVIDPRRLHCGMLVELDDGDQLRLEDIRLESSLRDGFELTLRFVETRGCARGSGAWPSNPSSRIQRA